MIASSSNGGDYSSILKKDGLPAGKPPVWLNFRSSKWLIGVTVFVGSFADGFLYSIIVPVLPFSLVDRSGVPEEHIQFWLSLLLMMFGITMTLGAPIAGWVADRSPSRKLPFVAGLGLAFLATLLFDLARAPWVLALARALQGFSASIVFSVGLALIADTMDADEMGSWMGFVLSGMNVGALVGPFLAGVVYERAGYHAVFGVAFGVIAFDLTLRLFMIEKKTAQCWLEQGQPHGSTPNVVSASGEIIAEPRHIYDGDSRGSSTVMGEDAEEQETTEPNERSSLLHGSTKRSASWLAATFPTMAVLLGSPRIRAAVYGCFTQTLLISAFDAILPIFVKRTFAWNSVGAGLIFLAITVPSTLGAAIGVLSDRWGTKKVSLLGFALTTPAVAFLGLVIHNRIGDKVVLVILLVFIGTGLNLLLAPLASDMFHEVELLTEQNPGTFGKVGAYAQAYSLFDAALGLATVVGPAWSGLFYETTGWPITVGTLAILCALGAVPVFRHTGGKGRRREIKKDGEDGV